MIRLRLLAEAGRAGCPWNAEGLRRRSGWKAGVVSGLSARGGVICLVLREPLK